MQAMIDRSPEEDAKQGDGEREEKVTGDRRNPSNSRSCQLCWPVENNLAESRENVAPTSVA